MYPFLAADVPLWTAGTPVLVAAAVSLLLAVSVRAWVADEAGMRLLRRSGAGWVTDREALRRMRLVCFPVSLVLGWVVARFAAPVLSVGGEGASAAEVLLVAALGLLAGATPWLFHVDARIHRLPDRVTLPLVALTGLLFLGAALLGHPRGWWALVGCAVFGLVFALLWFLGAVLSGGGMGLGDVKLAAPLGGALLALSSTALLVALLVMHLSAVAVVVYRRLTHGAGRRDAIAFGPHMFIGLWVTVVLGPVLAG
ncbi:A24 family peptidase [Brevibacterium litoralis]|uniref:A24 family peptidase n=1 Tax=Brevibacterium litoralis TaxID=3138935 RepID=UPI0032EB70F9